MKSYLIQYEEGNGYYCNCCRSTWRVDEVLEFESDDKAKEYCDNYNKSKTPDRDSEIIGVYVLAEEKPIFEN